MSSSITCDRCGKSAHMNVVSQIRHTTIIQRAPDSDVQKVVLKIDLCDTCMISVVAYCKGMEGEQEKLRT